MSNQQDVLTTVTVNGVSLGPFLQRDDYEVSQDVTKVRQPGGGWKAYPTAARTYADLVVHRTYEHPRDSAKMTFLYAAVGAARAQVSETQLDPNGKPVPNTTRRWAGVLSSVQVGATNTNDNGARELQLTVAVDTVS